MDGLSRSKTEVLRKHLDVNDGLLSATADQEPRDNQAGNDSPTHRDQHGVILACLSVGYVKSAGTVGR